MKTMNMKEVKSLSVEMDSIFLEESQEDKDMLLATLSEILDNDNDYSNISTPMQLAVPLSVPMSMPMIEEDEYFMSDLDESVQTPHDQYKDQYQVDLEYSDISDSSVGGSVRSISESNMSISSLSSNSLDSSRTLCSDGTYIHTSSGAGSNSITIEQIEMNKNKFEYRQNAIKNWKKKKQRNVSSTAYVARREIALKRPRTTSGKFQKSTVQFIPISQVK